MRCSESWFDVFASPLDAKDRLGHVQRADAERVSLSWDEKTHTTPSIRSSPQQVLGTRGRRVCIRGASKEGKGGFKQEGPATR